jgi:taurine dioxygenase
MTTMTTHSLGTFGLEVDAKLAASIDEDLAEALRRSLFEHQLLVFRDQHLSLDAQQSLMAVFGPVIPAPEGVGLVSNVRPDGILGAQELAFHSDASFAPVPYRALSLLATDVVDGATATRFASGRDAYTRLPDDLAARVANLEVLHVYDPDDYQHRARADATGPRTVHPVVLPHPDTGEPVLFVTELASATIPGLAADESERLLDELFGYLYDPTYVVEHRWNRGDLVVWDNVALQHARDRVDDAPRTLQRVVIGQRSVQEMFPVAAVEAAFAAQVPGSIAASDGAHEERDDRS